ncbi:hypothetical protein [Streptomyces parvulus]|uniref:hypothetical protein n=1 Tax=Streptomyces parvulus TaxID=146923 RepID=UPI00379CD88D
MTELTGAKLLSTLDTSAEYDVGFYPEGRQPTEGLLYRGRPLTELLDRFTREYWTLHGTPERFTAQRNTDKGAQLYELNLLEPSVPGPNDRPYTGPRHQDMWGPRPHNPQPGPTTAYEPPDPMNKPTRR